VLDRGRELWYYKGAPRKGETKRKSSAETLILSVNRENPERKTEKRGNPENQSKVNLSERGRVRCTMMPQKGSSALP